jgi:hypothetical protein
MKRAARALLAFGLWAGCAGYTAGMRADAKPAAGSAYVYGRFFIQSKKTPLGFDGYQTMGLVVRCADGSTYTIRFSNKNEVQVIPVRPSRCELVEIVYTDADGAVKGRRRPPRDWMHPEQLAAGHGYYFGDYTARAKVDSEWHVFSTELHWSWDMDPDADNYQETTDQMKRTFASLASLPTENKRLARLDPARARAAALVRPGEAPLSVERTAGLARFIKRSYSSPEECEAACPTGGCLPFRGEAGPAMTCVIRCAADKDCPTGLACNCPGSQVPDCRQVAETPSDPMAGFCLSTEPTGPRR